MEKGFKELYCFSVDREVEKEVSSTKKDKKTGEEYNNCSKMKGMIMNASIQYNKELGDVNNLEKGSDKINIVSTLLATLTTIYSQINQLFKKESIQ